MSAFVCVNLLATAAWAAESTTYTYDALGRLVTTTVSGGPSSGIQTSTSFDPAGNRTNQTVTGAPPSGPSFSIADLTVTEGGVATVTISRGGAIWAAGSVSYATANGTATAPADFAAASGTLAFAAGEASRTVAISTVDDTLFEGAESFSISLSSPSGGTSINDGSAVVTIQDNEDPPMVSIAAAATVSEGDAATFTVTKSGATSMSASVNYATANGTALAPGDFTAASGTLTFAAGETSKTITVATANDTAYENAESFTVGLSGASAATIGTATAAVSITDNDAAPVFSIADVAVTEGGSAVLTVTKSGATSMSASVNYATAPGTAVAPGDFTAASGTLTFAAGETSKTITIATTSDAVYENAESFTVGLSGASAATIGTATATVSIADNDAAPVFSIADVTVTEGGSAVLTVTKSGATSMNASVNYATAPGTAIAPGDFTATSGTLAFTASETSKTITIATTSDAAYENAESFTVGLSGASAATIGTSTAAINIADNDAAPVFSIADVAVTEGGSAVLTVTKSGATSMNASVNYATANGTAVVPGDFTAASGSLTFAAGETSKTITVATANDTAYENAESFTVGLSGASAATIGTATAAISIADNDAAPTFSISGATVTEGDTAVLTVAKTGATGVPASVNYATADGTATASTFYTAKSGSLYFEPAETSKTISVNVVENPYYDGNKAFSVHLSGASGAGISAASAAVNINDDEAVPTIYVGSGVTTSVAEGGTFQFTISVSGAPRNPVSVNYATASGTAVSGVDFTPASGTVSISTNGVYGGVTVNVATVDDTEIESDESFTMSIASPDGFAATQAQSSATITNNDFAKLPPVANTDNAGSMPKCGSVTLNPITNDTDPDGDYPLSLVSVSGGGFEKIISGNNVTLNHLGAGTTGTKTLTYVVSDSSGATATGSITVTITGGSSCL